MTYDRFGRKAYYERNRAKYKARAKARDMAHKALTYSERIALIQQKYGGGNLNGTIRQEETKERAGA